LHGSNFLFSKSGYGIIDVEGESGFNQTDTLIASFEKVEFRLCYSNSESHEVISTKKPGFLPGF